MSCVTFRAIEEDALFVQQPLRPHSTSSLCNPRHIAARKPVLLAWAHLFHGREEHRCKCTRRRTHRLHVPRVMYHASRACHLSWGVQEELREAFFDSSTEDATSKLRSAMEEIDLNSDGGVSLNELLVVGLGRSTSRLVRAPPAACARSVRPSVRRFLPTCVLLSFLWGAFGNVTYTKEITAAGPACLCVASMQRTAEGAARTVSGSEDALVR